MKKAYIDGSMGVTGSKLFGAFLDLTEDPDAFIKRFNRLGFDGLLTERKKDSYRRLSGTKIMFQRTESRRQTYEDEWERENGHAVHRPSGHKSRTLEDITQIIDALPVSNTVRQRAINIYTEIARASAKANNRDMTTMTMHRTGSKDIIASVVGVCMLIEEAGFEKISASPVAVGYGYTKTSNGERPIPIPALKNLLKDIPYNVGSEEGELCTLEGAALLADIVDAFEDKPDIDMTSMGIGFGIRPFVSGPNCIKVWSSIAKIQGDNTSAEKKTASVSDGNDAEFVSLEAVIGSSSLNTAAAITEKIKPLGASGIYIIPAMTPDGNKSYIFKCRCKTSAAEKAAAEIIKNTLAESVECRPISVYNTSREMSVINTSLGDVKVLKITGCGTTVFKPSPQDVADVASQNNLTYKDAYSIIMKEIS